MRKTCKILLGLAALGAAVGGLILYFSKKKCSCDCCDDCCDDCEDEDFDLDDDLEPIADREYVPLNSVPATEAGDEKNVKTNVETSKSSGETEQETTTKANNDSND